MNTITKVIREVTGKYADGNDFVGHVVEVQSNEFFAIGDQIKAKKAYGIIWNAHKDSLIGATVEGQFMTLPIKFADKSANRTFLIPTGVYASINNGTISFEDEDDRKIELDDRRIASIVSYATWAKDVVSDPKVRAGKVTTDTKAPVSL